MLSEPKVVEDLKGGHLALMQSMDEYLSIVYEFRQVRNPMEDEAKSLLVLRILHP